MFGADVSLHAASTSWLTFISPFGNFTFHLELDGMKLVEQVRGYFDITTYNDVCYSINAFAKGQEIILTGSLEMYDCNIGALSTIWEFLGWPSALGSALECYVKNYYFEQTPILRIANDSYKWWSQSIVPLRCLASNGLAW